jgi:uncharacterized protein YdhG (YjbR/CyaY superfamily)
MNAPKPNNVNEYIESFPKATQTLLKQIRATIKKAAPYAEELISYQMPAYKCNGPLVYFAGYKNHIGFYPTPSGILAFKKELAIYKTSKGAVQFPIDEKLPLGLITKIVKYRVKENSEK